MSAQIIVYLLVWVIWAGAVVEKIEGPAIVAAVIIGAIWPISLPIRLLRKWLW